MSIEEEEQKVRSRYLPDQSTYPSLVTPQEQPLFVQPFQTEGYKPPPDWSDTVEAAFRQYNDIYRLGQYAYDYANPFKKRTTREMGYNPIEEGILDGVPEQFHMSILMHDTREDALIAKGRAMQELEDMETLERSGTGLMVVSTLGATLVSPTTLIPAAQTIKYADPSKGFFMNALKTAQTMGPAIAMQNLAVIGTKETQDLTDWAYQTMFDTAIASIAGGVVGRFVSKKAGKNLDNMQAFFKSTQEDIDIKYLVNEKGEIVKPIAKAKTGVGAQQAEIVQQMLDSGQVEFKNNKIVKGMLSWSSPMIEGVTNRFDIVRRTVSEMFSNPYELAGGKVELIRGPDIYSWAKKWYALQQDILIEENALWQQYIGLSGVAKGARAEIGAWTGKWISKEEFSELIAKARRRGGESEIAEVKHMAQRYDKELYKPLFEELQKRFPTITEHQFSNITEYLNRSYNRQKIAQDPIGFENTITEYLTGKDKRLEAYHAPIQHVQTSIKEIRTAIKNAKAKLKKPVTENKEALTQKLEQVESDLYNLNREQITPIEGATPEDIKANETANKLRIQLVDSLTAERESLLTSLGLRKANLNERIMLASEIRTLEAKLAQNQEELRLLQDELNTNIRDGNVDLDLLEGKPLLNSEEYETVNQLNQPIREAEQEIKQAKLEEAKIGTIKSFEKVKQAGKETASLEEIVNTAAEDFRKLGAKQTLSNIVRTRNELIRQRDTIALDIAINKGQLAPDQLSALRAQHREIQQSLAATRDTYVNVKELLRQKDITIADFEDLIKATKKTSEKVQAGVKKAELTELRTTKEKARERVKAAEKKLEAANQDLFKKIEAGEVPEKLFYRTSKGYKLIDPEVTPKLRQVLGTENIKNAANSIRLNITQMNDEQVLGAIFDDVVSGGSNPMKNRVLLANDELLEPWLNNRMDILSGLYTDQLVKRIYMEDFFKNHGVDRREGMKGIVSKLTTERNVMEADILKIADKTEQVKQLKKLNSDFDKATKLLDNYYKMFMGNYVDRSTLAYKVSDGIKKFAVATLLGNLPILLLPEFFTPFFRMVMNEYINDGLVPAIKRMQYLIGKRIDEAGGAKVGYIRGSYADMGIGVNRYLGGRIQAMAGYGAEYQPKTILGRYLENISTFSQQFSLANYIMDFQEVAVAGASESRLIRTLKRWQLGEELTRHEIDMLDRARLNPTKKIGDRNLGDIMLEQYTRHGKDDGGGFVPNFHMWDNFEAASNFQISVEKMVREVLIKPGPLDVPFAFRDPVVSMFTQFTSYIFAATNNFTVPLLTKPDSQKIFGTLAMLAAGALVDPLRQLSRGDEPDLDPEKLLISALTNSGAFGSPVEGFFKMNAFFDWEPTRWLQSDRMKSKTLTIGPASGLYNMTSSVLSATLNGEMNKKDANRALKLAAGFGYNWWDRSLFDTMLDSTGLPADRKEAKRRKAVGE